MALSKDRLIALERVMDRYDREPETFPDWPDDGDFEYDRELYDALEAEYQAMTPAERTRDNRHGF
jgi:hypothetical protein